MVLLFAESLPRSGLLIHATLRPRSERGCNYCRHNRCGNSSTSCHCSSCCSPGSLFPSPASGLAYFFVLLRRRKSEVASRGDESLPAIASRTAVLLPTYNENPHHLMVSVEATSHGERLDWFVLSDTADPDVLIAEEKAFLALRQASGAQRLYYFIGPTIPRRKSATSPSGSRASAAVMTSWFRRWKPGLRRL
jgi:hypothetical protein